MNTKLYVGNLPYETTETDLQTLFEAQGQVSTINIVRDRATGQARGFAFVEMSDASKAPPLAFGPVPPQFSTPV